MFSIIVEVLTFEIFCPCLEMTETNIDGSTAQSNRRTNKE